MLTFNDRYYTEVIKKNNYTPIDEITKPLEDFSMDDMSKWICFYNLSESVVEEINKENTLFISGIGINKEPHIGTVSQILRIIEIQKKGYNVQVILGDMDCYNARGSDIEYSEKLVKKYLHFIEKLGFDYTKGTVRNQYDHEEVMKTAFMIAPYVTEEDFLTEEDLYSYYTKKGIIQGVTFPMKMSILLMFADFIHFGYTKQFKNIVVVSGIDEHVYVPKANKIAKKAGIDVNISGMFSKLVKGFNNQPKMSKSLPDSSIWVTMSLKEIENIFVYKDNSYEDYNDSIVYQLMSSTFMYSPEELRAISKHCSDKGCKWLEDKKIFASRLYSLCSKWDS